MEEAPAPSLTMEELDEALRRLIDEVDAVFASDHWAVLDNPTDATKHRLYDAAALRHYLLLLVELRDAARYGNELTIRILARVHLEAFLYSLYIHLGRYPAVERVAQDMLDELGRTHEQIAAFDQQLASEKRRARKLRKTVRATNAGIERWNTANPTETPKPLHEEPPISQYQTGSATRHHSLVGCAQ
jgi:hypothetical protein